MTKSSDPNALHWYVAFVKSCQERKVADALTTYGTECYLPVQKEVHKWSDRRKIVDRLVLPHMIFIRCRECDRVPVRIRVPQICGYMSKGGPYNAVVVPDVQLETFRAMVDRSGRSVDIVMAPPAPGDKVRVISGPLTGLECELTSVQGKKCLALNMGLLGTATVEFSLEEIEKI